MGLADRFFTAFVDGSDGVYSAACVLLQGFDGLLDFLNAILGAAG